MRTKFFKKLILLFSVVAAATHPAAGQVSIANRQQNNIMPHSPEAEAIAKYTALPVTLYTGIPEVSVPIYEIKGKSLKLPVSLGYNYNGFKPAEMASYAGLGWSVQGGGVITRMIKGRGDNLDIGTSGGEYEDYASVQTMAELKHEVLEKMALGTLDGEPDLYVFNCNGLSGKFILLKDSAYLFPYQNTRIQRCTGGFLITAANGDQYYFTSSETTVHKTLAGSLTVQPHISSWYITQIISADKADTINFSYNTYSYHQPPVYAETYTIKTSPGNSIGGDQQTWSVTSMSGDRISDAKTLSQITYKDTYINFTLDTARRKDHLFRNDTLYALHDINVYVGGNPYKTFTLRQAYNNGKLSLTGVDITGSLGNSGSVQKYLFEYENADTSSTVSWWDNKSIDKYGYYNGANNYGTMLFSVDDFSNAHYAYANRTPNFGYCNTNTLKRITYPTGGYTVFDYELNTVGGGVAGPGVRVKSISTFDNLVTSGAAIVKEYSYNDASMLFKGGVEVTDVTDDGDKCTLQPGCSNPLPVTTHEYTYQTGTLSALSELINTPFYYTQVTEVNRSSTGNGRTVYQFGSFNEDDPEVFLVSKTDQAYNGSSYVDVQQTTNVYNEPVEKFSFVGVRASLVEKQHTPDACYACAEPPSPDPTQAVVGLDKIYQRVIANTWSSAYKTLKESINTTWDVSGSNPVTDTTRYFYDNPDHFYPTRIKTKNSKGEYLTTFMKYPMDYLPSGTSSRDIIDSTFRKARTDAGTAYGNCYAALVTALSSYEPYATSSSQSTFNSIVAASHCESDFLSATTDTYDNRDSAWSNYYSVISAAQTASSVKWQKAVYWMLVNNMVSPVIEKYTTIHKADNNDYLLSATRNEYELVNNVAALTTVSETELSKPLLYSSFLANTGNYYRLQDTMAYDSHMNLVYRQKNHNRGETFLWGYNNQYPVASVINATPSGISGYTQSLLDYPASDAALQRSIDTIRSNVASSLVLVSGYSYYPPNGITSAKDPSGKIIFYEYDDFGRLRTVKDQDSNVVKRYCYTLYGQAYDCDGSAIYYNAARSGSYTRNDCPSGATPTGLTYIVPAGRYMSMVSATDANNKADADVTAYGQDYANKHGYCVYYNSEVYAGARKDDCESGDPDSVTITIPAGLYSSLVSKAKADSLAQAFANVSAQGNANRVGSCANSACSMGCPEGQKCINGACKFGYRVFIGSAEYDEERHIYVCTYYWMYPDGSTSSNYTLETHTPEDCTTDDI